MQVRTLTVGQLMENCYLVRGDESPTAVIVDPGEEAPRLLAAIEESGARLEAILLTHTHFDHIGAVAPVATATGAPVYCPQLEVGMLEAGSELCPPGFGPFDGWKPEHTVAGGERLELAGLVFDVLFTPGHSPGHVTYAIADEPALFSGDVLFRGSIGRSDLPGGDWKAHAASLELLLDRFPDETVVHAGHLGLTTLGEERATNPFIAEIVR